MLGHLVQADPLNVSNSLGHRPLQIHGANNVRLFGWNRGQKQVKTVAYQRFKLIIAGWI
jgi:hypothetical protein